MSSRLSIANHFEDVLDFQKLSEQIEVSIFYSEQGAPYCEFSPVKLVNSINFMPRYMTAEGGYPEMFPGEEDS